MKCSLCQHNHETKKYVLKTMEWDGNVSCQIRGIGEENPKAYCRVRGVDKFNAEVESVKEFLKLFPLSSFELGEILIADYNVILTAAEEKS